MHEHSRTDDLTAKSEAIADENNAKRAMSVDARLGTLYHLSPDHFTEHYEESSPGTKAEGAKLNITPSEDINVPNAQQILLRHIEVED